MTQSLLQKLVDFLLGEEAPVRGLNAVARQWDPRLDGLGVRLEAPAQAEHRLVEARWADPSEARDKRHIYVRVLDKDGTPLEGQAFRVSDGGVRIERTKGAGFDQFWGNCPMYGRGVYVVDIPDTTSDKIHLVSGTKENPDANTCYYLVFQRGADVPQPGPGPTPEPGPTPGPVWDEATRVRLLGLLEQAQAELDAARRLLGG